MKSVLVNFGPFPPMCGGWRLGVNIVNLLHGVGRLDVHCATIHVEHHDISFIPTEKIHKIYKSGRIFIESMFSIALERPEYDVVINISPISKYFTGAVNITFFLDNAPLVKGLFSMDFHRKLQHIIFYQMAAIFSSKCFFLTSSARNVLEKMYYFKSNERYVFCGIDDKFFDFEKRKRENKTILVVGDDNPRRNYGWVIKALSNLRSFDVDYRLWVVGERSGPSFEGDDFKSISEHVVFFEKIHDIELRDLYRTANCLLMASLDEGLGLPMIEAQLQGCPVVYARRSTMPELAGENDFGFLPDDVASFMEAVDSACRYEVIKPDAPKARRWNELLSLISI